MVYKTFERVDKMSYSNGKWEVVLYEHTSYPDEVQLILGVNGAAYRNGGEWKAITEMSIMGELDL